MLWKRRRVPRSAPLELWEGIEKDTHRRALNALGEMFWKRRKAPMSALLKLWERNEKDAHGRTLNVLEEEKASLWYDLYSFGIFNNK